MQLDIEHWEYAAQCHASRGGREDFSVGRLGYLTQALGFSAVQLLRWRLCYGITVCDACLCSCASLIVCLFASVDFRGRGDQDLFCSLEHDTYTSLGIFVSVNSFGYACTFTGVHTIIDCETFAQKKPFSVATFLFIWVGLSFSVMSCSSNDTRF
jgi:hypothetical protein